MPGPLPKPPDQRRRRNRPTVPTTNLPADGFNEPAPDPPGWVELGPAGSAWWEWAWSTPQAAAWSTSAHLPTVARRAALEDDLRALESEDFDGLGIQELRSLVKSLKAIVTNKAGLLSKVTELDDRLGLSPKSMAQLRWTIVAAEEPKAESDGNVVTPERWQRTGS